MFQLYLLTVLTNILVGHALARKFLSTHFERLVEHTGFINNAPYRIILGGASVLIGLINLFPSYPGDIAVLGDLFPSLAGIIGGGLLVFGYIRDSRSTAKTKTSGTAEGVETKTSGIAEEVEKVSRPYLNIVGIGSVIIGILHAVFPQAALL